jgi:hypothetical protein
LRAEQDRKRSEEPTGFLIRPFFDRLPPFIAALHCCGNMDSFNIPFSFETRISDKASVKEGTDPQSAQIIVKQ